MSIENAAGDLPSPGMVIMSPQRATIQPAPVYGRRSRIGTVNPVGAFFRAGSCESERCVFAIQTGRRASSESAHSAAFFFAGGSSSTPSAP